MTRVLDRTLYDEEAVKSTPGVGEGRYNVRRALAGFSSGASRGAPVSFQVPSKFQPEGADTQRTHARHAHTHHSPRVVTWSPGLAALTPGFEAG